MTPLPMKPCNDKGVPSTGSATHEPDQRTLSVVVALTASQFIFGGYSIVSREWVSEGGGLSYAAFLAYRATIGAITLAVGAKLVEDASAGPPRHIGQLELLTLSLLGFLSSLTFLGAIGSIGTFLPALCETLIPVYVCCVCVALRIESVHRGKVAGIACAVAGALLVAAREEERKAVDGAFLEMHHEIERRHLAALVIEHVSKMWVAHPSKVSMGLMMITFHIVAAGSYWTLKKQLLYRSSPLHLSSCANIMTACLALIVGLLCRGSNLGTGGWLPTAKNLFALGFSTFESVFGTGLMAWATKRTKTTNVVASMTLQPVFSSFISWAIIGKRLQADHALGMVLTTCGLLVMAMTQASEKDDQHACEASLASEKLLP